MWQKNPKRPRQNGRETVISFPPRFKKWLLSEIQDVYTYLFREIAKAMAYKNLDHKLKREYPFVVHHFIGGLQWKSNALLHVPALHPHRYSILFLFTLIMQVFIKKQQKNSVNWQRGGWKISVLHIWNYMDCYLQKHYGRWLIHHCFIMPERVPCRKSISWKKCAMP